MVHFILVCIVPILASQKINFSHFRDACRPVLKSETAAHLLHPVISLLASEKVGLTLKFSAVYFPSIMSRQSGFLHPYQSSHPYSVSFISHTNQLSSNYVSSPCVFLLITQKCLHALLFFSLFFPAPYHFHIS